MMAMTFRSLSSKSQQSDGIFLVFQIFILLAPLCKWLASPQALQDLMLANITKG